MKRIILFDGMCHFCEWNVHFIIKRDPQAKFKFAPLQSEMAKKQLNKEISYNGTIVLMEDSQIYTKSTAALRICRQLSALWPVLYILIFIPRPVRDILYRIIAKNRYRWFGRKSSCMIPSPEIQKRFLK